MKIEDLKKLTNSLELLNRQQHDISNLIFNLKKDGGFINVDVHHHNSASNYVPKRVVVPNLQLRNILKASLAKLNEEIRKTEIQIKEL